jgi:hypothetical protein
MERVENRILTIRGHRQFKVVFDAIRGLMEPLKILRRRIGYRDEQGQTCKPWNSRERVAFFYPCNYTGAVREVEARSIGGDV